MSTQPVPEPEPPLIEDKPPAGTGCLVCKSLGHYCPAAKYIGQTDDGICKHCAAQENCPVAARKVKEYDVFMVPVDSLPPAVKTFSEREKREVARAENARKALAGGFGQDALKAVSKPGYVFPPDHADAIKSGMASAKAKGVRIGRPAAANVDPQRIKQLREEGKSFREIADMTGVALSTTARNFPKPPFVPVPSYMAKSLAKQKIKRPAGRPGKPLDLNRARDLRLEGKGFKDVGRELGVGVIRLKRELGHPTPKRPSGVEVVNETRQVFDAVSLLKPEAVIHVTKANMLDPDEAKAVRAQVTILPADAREAPLCPFDEVIGILERDVAEKLRLIDLLKAAKR